MNIILENETLLRGDMIVSATLRTDIVPVPVTLEATLRLDHELIELVREGKTLKAGRTDTRFKIIKITDSSEVKAVQGARPYGTISFIAILYDCYKLAYIANKAVIKDVSSIGTIYKACGATAVISNDLPITGFACYQGDYPTKHISKLFQEEAATVFWNGYGLTFIRLDDLFKQAVSQRIAVDNTESLSSEFNERHQVPYFYSTDANGNISKGDVSKARNAQFVSQTDPRVLKNLSKVLINRKVMNSSYALERNAGDLFEISGRLFVVMTAMHHYSANNNFSRFWLGSL